MKPNREQIINTLKSINSNSTWCILSSNGEWLEVSFLDIVDLVMELVAENERLKAEVSVKKKLLDKCVSIEDKARADIVHRMQSGIKEACIMGGIWPAFVAGVVKGVGEKILEESL